MHPPLFFSPPFSPVEPALEFRTTSTPRRHLTSRLPPPALPLLLPKATELFFFSPPPTHISLACCRREIKSPRLLPLLPPRIRDLLPLFSPPERSFNSHGMSAPVWLFPSAVLLLQYFLLITAFRSSLQSRRSPLSLPKNFSLRNPPPLLVTERRSFPSLRPISRTPYPTLQPTNSSHPIPTTFLNHALPQGYHLDFPQTFFFFCSYSNNSP